MNPIKKCIDWLTHIQPSKSEFTTHESVTQSYQLLDLVLQMIDRWDSIDTIKMVIEYIREE
jgi:hypothetical protein